MAKSIPCEYCGHDVPLSADRCPHCARHCFFPNVRAAEDPAENEALERRYRSAKRNAAARGAETALDNFEADVMNSKAVITRSINEVERLASSDNELYAAYYRLIDAGVRLPDGGEWDVLRVLTDDVLFSGYREEIRFGALSLNGIGLFNYGECSIVLRTDMIAHRASVFEENTVMFMVRKGILSMIRSIARKGIKEDAPSLPRGYRATWENRGKLCIAKLSDSIDTATKADEYSDLLLKQGATSEEDKFVEVHIFGPMTVRTIERVVFDLHKKTASRARIKALEEKLKKAGVTF